MTPIWTASIDARMGQPIVSSVTPRLWSTSTWPAAFAPPWLPMHGTTNGSAPMRFSSATTVARITSMPVMPRLPAVTATDMPGRTLRATPRRANFGADGARHIVQPR